MRRGYCCWTANVRWAHANDYPRVQPQTKVETLRRTRIAKPRPLCDCSWIRLLHLLRVCQCYNLKDHVGKDPLRLRWQHDNLRTRPIARRIKFCRIVFQTILYLLFQHVFLDVCTVAILESFQVYDILTVDCCLERGANRWDLVLLVHDGRGGLDPVLGRMRVDLS